MPSPELFKKRLEPTTFGYLISFSVHYHLRLAMVLAFGYHDGMAGRSENNTEAFS